MDRVAGVTAGVATEDFWVVESKAERAVAVATLEVAMEAREAVGVAVVSMEAHEVVARVAAARAAAPVAVQEGEAGKAAVKAWVNMVATPDAETAVAQTAVATETDWQAQRTQGSRHPVLKVVQDPFVKTMTDSMHIKQGQSPSQHQKCTNKLNRLDYLIVPTVMVSFGYVC